MNFISVCGGNVFVLLGIMKCKCVSRVLRFLVFISSLN